MIEKSTVSQSTISSPSTKSFKNGGSSRTGKNGPIGITSGFSRGFFISTAGFHRGWLKLYGKSRLRGTYLLASLRKNKDVRVGVSDQFDAPAGRGFRAQSRMHRQKPRDRLDLGRFAFEMRIDPRKKVFSESSDNICVTTNPLLVPEVGAGAYYKKRKFCSFRYLMTSSITSRSTVM